MKNIVYDFTNGIFVIIERSIYSNWIYHTVIYHHRIAEILYTTIVNWFLICNIFNDYIVFLYIVLNALGFWETYGEVFIIGRVEIFRSDFSVIVRFEPRKWLGRNWTKLRGEWRLERKFLSWKIGNVGGWKAVTKSTCDGMWCRKIKMI